MSCAAAGIRSVFTGATVNPRVESVQQVVLVSGFSHRGLAVGPLLRRSSFGVRCLSSVDSATEPAYEGSKKSRVGVFNARLETATKRQRTR